MVYNLRDTTILWLSLFGNIHTAYDLDTCDDGRQYRYVVLCLFLEHTIDTETNTDVLLHRFDMNIGCSLANRQIDHFLYELYDWRAADLFLLLHVTLYIQLFLLGVLIKGILCLCLSMILIDGEHDTSGRSDDRIYLIVGDDGDIFLCIGIEWILHRYTQDIFVLLIKSKRYHRVLFQDMYRHHLRCRLINTDILEVYDLNIQLTAQRHRNIILRNNSLIDQCLAKLHA